MRTGDVLSTAVVVSNERFLVLLFADDLQQHGYSNRVYNSSGMV